MKLSYSGQEKVQAPPAVVWAFMQDPARVARCLPEVQDVQVTGPNQLVASVPFGSGLMRGKLKFNIEVHPDQAANRVQVIVKGGGLGSAVDMTAGATLRDGGDGTTTLDWNGDIEMRGPLASVGGRMMDTQAERLIAKTFRNISNAVSEASHKLA